MLHHRGFKAGLFIVNPMMSGRRQLHPMIVEFKLHKLLTSLLSFDFDRTSTPLMRGACVGQHTEVALIGDGKLGKCNCFALDQPRPTNPVHLLLERIVLLLIILRR
jgi:hypothetical protein